MSYENFLKKLDKNRFEISKNYQSEAMQRLGIKMNVPGLIYTNEAMLDAIKQDGSLEQVANVATLPGIVGRSIAMPDIHCGYGFAIGGVAAFDAKNGVISPGGVGYDINCGVRLIRTDLTYGDIEPKLHELIDTISYNVPAGMGEEGKMVLSMDDMDSVLTKGARWATGKGYGWRDDLEVIEEGGCLEGADPSLVSEHAKKRGSSQLGTLGSGNHFLEVQRVDTIYNPQTAFKFGITSKGQVTIMIHTGSRGCGHQICTDYLEVMREANQRYRIPLVDRELSCAPASSNEAREYFAAMKCAANYAWANRQVITHQVRESFERVFGRSARAMGLHVVYDVAHNMAKLEEYEIDGEKRKLYIHRKGATRAFGPNRPEVPQQYRDVGQPVIIPGDMGRASYLLVGTDKAMEETFGSSCHGAGRQMSRHAAQKRYPANKVEEELAHKGIYVRAASRRGISEEAPGAYKNIDDVVEVSHEAGITKKVARMVPMGVVKG